LTIIIVVTPSTKHHLFAERETERKKEAEKDIERKRKKETGRGDLHLSD